MVDKSVVEDFLKAIQPADKNTDHTYNATVTRVDKDGVVWVQVAGSDKETPTSSTSSEVKRGDAVNVQWRNNKLYVAGNYTNPSAGSVRVRAVEVAAQVANQAASNAVADAGIARQAAESAQSDAARAKSAADGASEYAARAFGNLSTVQSITETLTWITQHGTMTLTTDVALDPTHVYFVQDAGGDYVVGGVTYAVVTEPDVADIATYYELSIDESLNNYVGTHLALTSEGLWLIPEAGGNKVLIATGGVGHTYEDAGTYIIDENDNISAQFLEDGATIYGPSNVLIAHLGYGPGADSSGYTRYAPYYTLGTRSSGTVGNYSVVEGRSNNAAGANAHAEGWTTSAAGANSHAEGFTTRATGAHSHAEGGPNALSSGELISTTASGAASHAEGWGTKASGDGSHSQNDMTIAAKSAQTALGTYNIEDTASTTTHPNGYASYGQYAVIVGNGTSSARSNALTVDWNGNVDASGGITTGGDVDVTGDVVASGAVTCSNIGVYKSHVPDAVSCATGKYFQVAHLELTKGTWLLDANAAFTAINGTGIRAIRITTATSGYNNVTSPPSAVGNIAIDSQPAANATLYPQVHLPVQVSSTTTYRLCAFQNSGSSVNVTGRMYATRIK